MKWTPALREPRPWIVLLLLCVVVFTVYHPVVRAGYVWDDDAYVSENGNLRDVGGLQRIWTRPLTSPQYYPLVFTTFWAERQLFGESAAAHHAVNIALHTANAFLLWLMLKRLRVPGALVAALVFAVHPVHVESVAWITERKNVLSGFFYLGSLLAYLAFADLPRDGTPAATRGRALSYGLSVFLFVCALLSKTVTATLPAVLLVVLWWRGGRVRRRDVAAILPLLALGVGLGLLTAWLEVRHVGAAGDDWALPAMGRLLLAGRIVAFYAWKLVWPHPLMFFYPRWAIDAGQLLQYLFPAGVAVTIAALWWWRGSLGRGPLAAALCFIGSLSPVLGFLNVYPMRYSWVADHFQYLPSIAVIALLAAAANTALWRLKLQRASVIVAATLVVALGAVTRAETNKFHTLESLWLDTLDKNPTSSIAHNNLGILRMKQGRLHEAAKAFERALAIDARMAEAYNNLGTALFYLGDTERAIENHTTAVELKPTYAEALNNLGVELASAGKDREAIGYCRRALAARPDYAMAHYNAANGLARLGEDAQAEQEYRQAIALDPGSAMARFNLGVRLLSRGRDAEAAGLLEEAFRLKPDFAAGHYRVGNILLERGDAAGAAACYARALQHQPGYPEAHSNLGIALMRLGDVDRAIASFERAIDLAPRYAVAHTNLGVALEQRGQLDEALAQFRSAVKLDPKNAGARANMLRLAAATAHR